MITLAMRSGIPNFMPRLRSHVGGTGAGTVRFHKASWSDLPTMHHVVNAFAHCLSSKRAVARSRSRVTGRPTATSACFFSAAGAKSIFERSGKQKPGAPFRFRRNGKGSRQGPETHSLWLRIRCLFRPWRHCDRGPAQLSIRRPDLAGNCRSGACQASSQGGLRVGLPFKIRTSPAPCSMERLPIFPDS